MLENSQSNIPLKYFQRPQIQHATVTCKIQCIKFSVNIQGPKEEQSILDARTRSSKEIVPRWFVLATNVNSKQYNTTQ